MQTGVTTTGLQPLTIGSVERFQLDPILNGLPWDPTGGSVKLSIADPLGNVTTVNAIVISYGAYYDYTIVGPASIDDNGTRLAAPWRRAWVVTDAAGVHQVSRAVAFEVVSSPA